MSKKLISLTLAILLVVSMTAAFPAPVRAAPGDLLANIKINYKDETITYTDSSRSFIQYALNSAAQDTTDQKLLAKEKWQVVRLTGNKVEIDISRVIPRAGRPAYNIAFMVPGDVSSRSVISIPARPANRNPASGVPVINVGKPRNDIGIFFVFDDVADQTYIVNRTGTDVAVQFPSNARPAWLANKVIELAEELTTDDDAIAISTNALTRAQPFTVYIPAVEEKLGDGGTVETAGSFASLPVKLSVPAQPKAPVIKQTFSKNDKDIAEFNFKAGRTEANGLIRTGYPQVRLNGEADWVTLDVKASKTPLVDVLEALRLDGAVLAEMAEGTTKSLFIRISSNSVRGVSAVQRIEIQAVHWNKAFNALPDTPIVVPTQCEYCEQTPCASPCENGDCGYLCCDKCTP